MPIAKKQKKKIALVAGALRLPFLLRDALKAGGWDVFTIGIKNFADTKLRPDMWTRLGAIGTVVRELRRHEIKDMVMVGALKHPNLSDIVPDLMAIKILARVIRNQRGDDSMLRTLGSEIERLGFRILAGQDLCPDLTFGKGLQTKAKPGKADMDDIKRATEVARTIGNLDIGQSAVAHKKVLAVEAVEGTADMLRRTATLNRKRGGVLVKLAKPMQDLRLDLPAIGADTVKDAIAARLSGIVVEAKKCYVIDKEQVLALADKNKIFILAL